MHTAKPAYLAALGLSLFASLALIWLSLGVGIIGADGDRRNMLYAAVVIVGLAGAFITRLDAAYMARTLAAMAFTQALIGVVAVVAGWGLPASPAAEVLGVTAGFVGTFIASGWLFQRAAKATGMLPAGRRSESVG